MTLATDKNNAKTAVRKKIYHHVESEERKFKSDVDQMDPLSEHLDINIGDTIEEEGFQDKKHLCKITILPL